MHGDHSDASHSSNSHSIDTGHSNSHEPSLSHGNNAQHSSAENPHDHHQADATTEKQGPSSPKHVTFLETTDHIIIPMEEYEAEREGKIWSEMLCWILVIPLILLCGATFFWLLGPYERPKNYVVVRLPNDQGVIDVETSRSSYQRPPVITYIPPAHNNPAVRKSVVRRRSSSLPKRKKTS